MAIKLSGSTIIDDSRNIVNAGIVTATSFSGDGSELKSVSGTTLATYASASDIAYSAKSIVGFSTYNQVGILTAGPTNLGNGDKFGRAVAMSANGKTLFVGAPDDEINGAVNSSGAVYVFERVGSGSSFNQLGILTGSSENGQFGESIACSADGKTVVVNAVWDANYLGLAYVFDRSGDTYTRVGILSNSIPDPNNYSGPYTSADISADGKFIILSNEGVAGPGATDDTGAVFLWKRDGDTFTEVGIVTNTRNTAGSEWSESIAISGDGKTIVVGALSDYTGSDYHGSVSIFDVVGVGTNLSFNNVGILTGFLYSGDSWDAFGSSVDINYDGSSIIVGDFQGEIEGGTAATGTAHVYDRVGDTYSLVQTFIGSDPRTNGAFGNTVVMSPDGKQMLVAAQSEIPNKVYKFERYGNTITQVGIITAYSSDYPLINNIGTPWDKHLAMSADAKSILVGYEQANIGGISAGAAVVFDAVDTTVLSVEPSGNIAVTGIITATAFYGDGSNLTGISGGGGSSTFLGLSDTPSAFTASKYLAINSGGTAIEFVDAPSGGSGGIALTDLSVGADGTASGSGSLSYNNTTGVFTYTPPDLSSYLTSYTVTASDLSGISIDALSDVDTSSTAPTDGQALLWNNTNSKWEPGTVSSSGGTTTFLGLTDTPSAFTASKFLAINSGGTAIEFVDAPSGGGGIALTDLSITTAGTASGGGSLSYDSGTGVFTFTPADTSGGGGGSSTFLGLSDTPGSFTASKYLAVNSAGDAVEFVDAPSGGSGSSTFLALTDTPSSFGTAGQVLAVNSSADGLEFVTASSGGGGGGISVGTRTGTTDNDDLVTGVTELRFAKAPFTVSDLGSGKVLLLTESSFNPIQVNGETGVTASGEETLNLVAGTGVTIVADNTSTPKSITISASGGSGGGGGASTLADLTDTNISSPATGAVLKWNGTAWFAGTDNVGSGGGGGGGGGDGSAPLGANSRLDENLQNTYAGGLLGLTNSTQINDAIDQLNQILVKLAPPTPDPLSLKQSQFYIQNSYGAIQAGTNESLSTVVDTGRPQSSTVQDFYDGANGTLTFTIDDVQDGQIALSENVDGSTNVGTDLGLTITSDTDPYAGATTGANFWEQISAKVQASTTHGDLTPGENHTYTMTHSSTGSVSAEFFVDAPNSGGALTVSGESVDTSATNVGYVSGVPTFTQNATIAVSCTVNGAVTKAYNSTKVCTITSSVTNPKNVGPDSAGYNEGDAITLSAIPVAIGGYKFSDGDFSLSLKGVNSKGTAGNATSLTVPGRVDTKSNESSRKTSGSGDYPASGFGDTYDSTQSLASNEELQMRDGKFVYPSTDYSSNALAGPNYSSLSGTRWVTFPVSGPANKGGGTCNITATGLSAVSEFSPWQTKDNNGVIKILFRLSDTGDWMSLNDSFSPGPPMANGVGIVKAGDSSHTNKAFSFPAGAYLTSASGYVKIGLDPGSTATITSVSVSY